jgi:hypothetical protein
MKNEKLRGKLYSTSPTLSKLRKKINTKLYPMRLKNFPFTPEVLDNNFNVLNPT